MKIRETRDSPISGFLHDVSKTPALVQGSKYPPIQRFANDHVIACVAKELTLPPSQNFQKHHFPQRIYHKNKEQRYGKHHIHNRVMERRSAMLHSRYWVARKTCWRRSLKTNRRCTGVGEWYQPEGGKRGLYR
jgi:hypothetical protein